MPFVSRQQADPKVRVLHEKKHQRQLKQQLCLPGLSPAQVKAIQEELNSVPYARVYTDKKPPKAGAIKLEPHPIEAPKRAASATPRRAPSKAQELSALKKTELVKLAKRLHVPVSGTKKDLLDRIKSK